MDKFVALCLCVSLGMLYIGYADSQATASVSQQVRDAAMEIVRLAKDMQANIDNKNRCYQDMGAIANQVSIVVTVTDVDNELKSKGGDRADKVNGFSLAGGILSGIGGALSKAGGG